MLMMMMTMMIFGLQASVLAELEGVVLLEADENRITSSFDDVSSLPNKLVKSVCNFLTHAVG